MKHPQREEWAPFLFGEATADVRTKLTAHLAHCPECATEIAAWRRSIGRLDEWRLPAREATPRAAASGLRWAVAASVVLGLGFGLGWIAKPSGPEAAELRAQVETSVKAAFASEVRPQIMAEVERASTQSQDRTSNALAALEVRLARASETGSRQVLQGLTTVWHSAREEDRQVFATLLDQLQEQRATDYVSLRKDLETLATLTDDEMRQARSRLNQLAARTLADNEK
jgi:anti-sigma factor RsiW